MKNNNGQSIAINLLTLNGLSTPASMTNKRGRAYKTVFVWARGIHFEVNKRLRRHSQRIIASNINNEVSGADMSNTPVHQVAWRFP